MAVFSAPSFDNHELVVFRNDPKTGLRAIIAVHNTNLGPALGGCRMYPYASDAEALEDVLRLSRGMTYKSALAGLPYGGGKAVILGDPRRDKTPALLHGMGEFIDSLGGRYITAEDSGTCVEDMKILREKTRFVSGVNEGSRFGGDPSPYTAYGVYCGMVAAVRHRFGRDSVEGLRVALQGAGAVGRHLAERLMRNGATVYAADIAEDNLARVGALGAEIVGTDEVLTMEADILAPCAMGAVVNDETVDGIRATIIAGSANNQLASPAHGERLRERGILYAPDFVINAGGIIDVHYQRIGGTGRQSEAHVERIAPVLEEIFRRAERDGVATERVAEQLAEEIFTGRRGSIAGNGDLVAAAVL